MMKVSHSMLFPFLLIYLFVFTYGTPSKGSKYLNDSCKDIPTSLMTNQTICKYICFSNLTYSIFESKKSVSIVTVDEIINLPCKGLETSNWTITFNWTCTEQDSERNMTSFIKDNFRNISKTFSCFIVNGNCTKKGKKCFLLIINSMAVKRTTSIPETSTSPSIMSEKFSKLRTASTKKIEKVTVASNTKVALRRRVSTTIGLKKDKDGHGLVSLISGWVFGSVAFLCFLVLLAVFIYKKRTIRQEDFQLPEVNRTEPKDESHYQALVFKNAAPSNPYQECPNESTALPSETVNISNTRENSTGQHGTLDSSYVISNQRGKLANITYQTARNEEIYDDVGTRNKAHLGIYCKPSLVNSNAATKEGVSDIRNRTLRNEEIYDDVGTRNKAPVGMYCKPSSVNSNTATKEGVSDIRNRLEVLLQTKG